MKRAPVNRLQNMQGFARTGRLLSRKENSGKTTNDFESALKRARATRRINDLKPFALFMFSGWNVSSIPDWVCQHTKLARNRLRGHVSCESTCRCCVRACHSCRRGPSPSVIVFRRRLRLYKFLGRSGPVHRYALRLASTDSRVSIGITYHQTSISMQLRHDLIRRSRTTVSRESLGGGGPHSVRLNSIVAIVIITNAAIVRKARSPAIAVKPASFSRIALKPWTE
jgi:hypothetical protein